MNIFWLKPKIASQRFSNFFNGFFDKSMCGFVGCFDLNSGSAPIAEGLKEELRAQVLEMSKRIRHRGPDWSGVYTGDNAILSHERLSIVDPLSGKQPLVSDDEKIILAANGEIYNHK